MEQNRCPEYSIHKSEHEAILQKVENIQDIYSRGDKDINVSLRAIIKMWIEEHKKIEDKKLGDFLNNKSCN